MIAACLLIATEVDIVLPLLSITPPAVPPVVPDLFVESLGLEILLFFEL